jgi:hypothetical protein
MRLFNWHSYRFGPHGITFKGEDEAGRPARLDHVVSIWTKEGKAFVAQPGVDQIHTLETCAPPRVRRSPASAGEGRR